MFYKVLIANRGEIARRIIRACHESNIRTVAVFSDADRNAPFVTDAQEAVYIGESSPAESYLNMQRIIDAAIETGAEAIHPGYGFLSEKAEFAELCEKNGITFIGPKSSVIRLLGPKIQAKEVAKRANVPVVPGYEGDVQDYARFEWEAGEIGYPVLLKASAGGGGRGMRIVQHAGELKEAFESAKREAESAFGNGDLLLEKYFETAKHIEVQIVGDNHGNYHHLFERECSVQRRYQKIIEESPSPSLSEEQRVAVCEAAKRLAEAVQYNNVGTVEFLLAPDGNFYFLEVNTRLQVEHGITEMVCGLDIVKTQLFVASGNALEDEAFSDLQPHGWAIECRICAEDPSKNFAPSTGTIGFFGITHDHIQGLRLDSGVIPGSEISVYYDSMLAKLMMWAPSRSEAIRGLVYCIDNFAISGVKTNLELLKSILLHRDFQAATVDTKWIDRNLQSLTEKTFSESANFNSAVVIALADTLQASKNKPYDPSLSGWRNSFYAPQQLHVNINDEVIAISYRQLDAETFEVMTATEPIRVKAKLLQRNYDVIELFISNRFYQVPFIRFDSDFHVWWSGIGVMEGRILPRFKEPEVENDGSFVSPMPGEIIKIMVKEGEEVKEGQKLLVLSSMKMESNIEAAYRGIVKEIYVEEKQFVEAGKVLIKLEEIPA